MKIRFNWGTGIVAAIVLIVAGLGVLVWIAARQDFDLVDKDYYQKGVNYQKQIDKIRNANALSEKLTYEIDGGTFRLKFPDLNSNQKPNGELFFYCPVNSANDYRIPVHLTDSLVQEIDRSVLKKGRYILKVDWSCDSVDYYQEINLTIE